MWALLMLVLMWEKALLGGEQIVSGEERVTVEQF